MKFDLSRTKVGTAAMVAFAGGMVLAGAFDLTPFSHAQQARVGNTPIVAESRAVTDLSNAFVSIAEAVTPAVVSIRAESQAAARTRLSRPGQDEPPRQNDRLLPPGWEDFFRGQPDFNVPQEPAVASGTGFIVSSDGYILTNNHVITRSNRTTRQEKVTVTLNDGRVFPAKIIGNDPETDVAVLKIEASNLSVARMGDDNDTRIGEWVVAIGNPLGLDFTVTAGIVSAKGRRTAVNTASRYQISDFIQTDAAINPGNSGGPLLNIRGEVIGINSMIASNNGYFQGYGFAIPITLANEIKNNLIEYGRIRASVLGVSIQEVDPEDAEAAGLKTIRGVRVTSFSPDSVRSPAARGGVQLNDIILEVNGRPVDRVATLQRTIRSYAPGTTIDVKLMRGGQERTVRVRLEERPETTFAQATATDPAAPASELTFQKLGVSVEQVTPEWLGSNQVGGNIEGLAVTDVAPGRTSAEKLRGLIITEVIRPGPATVIKTEADLEKVLARFRDGEVVSFRGRAVERNGRSGTLSAPIVVNVRIGS